MKNTREYAINFATETITITKRFGKAASDFNTAEHRTMMLLRKEYPTFKFEYKAIKKKETKHSYKGLSIDEMRRFMKTRTEKEQDTFEKVVILADTKQSKYAVIKKWFLNHYKDEYNAELETLKAEEELAELESELNELDDEE